MVRLKQYIKIIILDTLAIFCMVGALLIGWLPGPGGIPLFLVGLGLLAINHDWAERYIKLLEMHADRIGDLIFRPRLWRFFDLLSLTLLVWGFYILVDFPIETLRLSGISIAAVGVVVFLANRNRWKNIKNRYKNKH